MRNKLALALLVAFMTGGGAAASPPVSDSLNESQALSLVLEALDARDVGLAREIVASYRQDDVGHAYRVRFVEALILESGGDLERAAAAYRAILDEQPDNVGVRVRLSKVLFALGRDDVAKYQLERLVELGMDEKLGGELRHLIAQIDARRPVQFRWYGSILPSTNLMSGTNAETVVIGGIPMKIDDAARSASGYGVLGGGEIEGRHPLSEEVSLVGTVSGEHRWYPGADRSFSRIGATAGVSYASGPSRYSAVAIGGRDFADFVRSYDYLGVKGEFTVPLLPSVRASGSVTGKLQEFARTPGRDGQNLASVVKIDRHLSSATYIRAIVGAETEAASDSRFDYVEGTIGVGAFHEFGSGLSLYGEATLSPRSYEGTFPGSDEPRSDLRWTASGTVTKRDFEIFGLAPQLTYTYTNNQSNSVFDNFDRHDIEFKLTSSF